MPSRGDPGAGTRLWTARMPPTAGEAEIARWRLCLRNVCLFFLTPSASLAAWGVRCRMARLLEGSVGSMRPGRHQGEAYAHEQ